MGSSDSSSAEDIPPPLHLQPEWADVIPEPVGDGGKVGSIRYMPDHAEALGYFRALVKRGEHSQRALDLTTLLLVEHNPADYTVWQWRWECLQELGAPLDVEYELCESIALDNVKNYQLWNHRRKCSEAIGQEAAARELAFAQAALSADAKNYHAWAHRQAVVRRWGLWEGELTFVDRMLAEDVLNNSAWNQRMFVIKHTLSSAEGGVRGAVAREVRYTCQRIMWEPNNEAAWAYLRGLLLLPGLPPHSLGRCREVFKTCRDALEACPYATHALDTLALYYGDLAAACLAAGDADKAAVAAQAADAVVGQLAEVDPLRGQYWQHRRQELTPLLQAGGQ